MRNIARLFALLLALLPGLAVAQSAPPTMPANTVYGRLGIPGDTGPGQAIPFATLLGKIAPASATLTVPCGGTADDAAINAAITSVAGAGGGTITLQGPSGAPGHCVMTGALAIPFTGTSPPVQPYIRITGQAVNFDGTLNGGSSNPGTNLDLRYTGVDTLHPAKIDTRGSGVLEIDHLTISDGATDNFLFLQTTNTTLNIHDVHFRGNASCSGTTCQQDILQFGGITSASGVLGGVLATNGFQGYGTKISNVYFSNCRHAANFGGSANGIYLANLTTDLTCGSSETHGAPFTFYGVGLGAAANTFSGGIVELFNYPHAFSMTGSGQNPYNTVLGMGFYDPTGTTISIVYADANALFNTFIPSIAPETIPITGAGASLNTFILNNGPSVFPINGNASPSGASIVGGYAANSVLALQGSANASPSGDAILFNSGGARAGSIQDALISWSLPTVITSAVASITALQVNGIAGNLYLDFVGAGGNFIDGTTTTFRTFAGTAVGNFTSSGLTLNSVAGSGTRCLQTSNAGLISVASGGCGGGGTVTTVGFTGGLISVANPTTTPALTVAGTSGGIPYFSSASTWASSALLAANALMVGGGAGVAPSTVTTGANVLTALGIAIGSAGAPVVLNGALGSPSSAGTLPAFTMGGNVAGNTKNISNAGTLQGSQLCANQSNPTVCQDAAAALSVQNTTGTSAIHLNGIAANMYIDFVGSGTNYLDATTTNFRTFGGTGIASITASGLAVLGSAAISTASGSISCGGTTVATSTVTGCIVDSGGLGVAGAGWFGTYVAVTPTLVASLPSCTSGIDGARAYVTNNATALGVIGSAITTGGAIHTPVYCDGSSTSWKQGRLEPANDNLPRSLIRKYA